ncbi:carboxypeptidase regulatory-like domain-containing protein [Rufibacter psychrotolerans]|uniref:carboxypeptidase regulatory-like domain-containing protein n=1 Tax=Rufibacter psychrotolerans TaxID=2812556 RepID=UPI0019687339|nr:carboxypeptidase regulatory-like domain-containing protein [Rufibacter sp. SYSU D00308]
MSRINLPEDWGPDEHPSLELLRRYQAGDLPAPLAQAVERHLLSCELCSDLVEGLALSPPARVRTAVRETRGRLKNLLAQKKRKRKAFQWPVWQTAAVLLVLLFALGEVVYHHYFDPTQRRQAGKPAATAEATWLLRGKVLDAAGLPLAGASVRHSGTSTGVVTDANGAFRLPLQTTAVVVVVSHPGYETQEIPARQEDPALEVTLRPIVR